jgi:hypothetical protein
MAAEPGGIGEATVVHKFPPSRTGAIFFPYALPEIDLLTYLKACFMPKFI